MPEPLSTTAPETCIFASIPARIDLSSGLLLNVLCMFNCMADPRPCVRAVFSTVDSEFLVSTSEYAD